MRVAFILSSNFDRGIKVAGKPQFIYPVQLRYVSDETMGGIVNGTNVTFTTSANYIPGSLTIYLNGLKQRAGLSNDYIEVDDQTIQMNYAPLPGDVVVADYLRKN